MTRLSIVIGAALSFGPTATFGQTASPWPEADRIFHSDSRWLGSDGGFSIDLGNGRVLWSFGDTLVVKKAGDTRKMAAFVHNTVAIETGYDPSAAQMKYYWRRWGSHMEIFPSDGKVWMWPSHGIRIDSRLVVFCSRVQNNPKKESLGFEGVGSQAFVIENPDVEPTDWKMKTVMKDGAEVGGSVERCEKDLPSAGRRSSARANVRGQSPSRVEGRGFDHHLRDQWIG